MSDFIDRRGLLVLSVSAIMGFFPEKTAESMKTLIISKLSPLRLISLQSLALILMFLLSLFGMFSSDFKPFIYFRF